MSFLAYCPYCEKKVTATTILGGSSLEHALENDLDVVVVHLTEGSNEGDHKWKLNRQETGNLRKAIAEGHLKASSAKAT